MPFNSPEIVSEDKIQICPANDLPCPVAEERDNLLKQLKDLKTDALTDVLTGLFNRRHFESVLAIEMERTQRTSYPTTLVMLDLDHFKKINDSLGHLAGDTVLKEVATLLKSNLRKIDIPCRIGGEEIIAILPSTELMTGVQVAERICIELRQHNIELDNKSLNVTASFGVYAYHSGSNDSSATLLEKVDQLVYQAKHKGRDQVCAPKDTRFKSATSVSADEKALFHDLFGGSDES